MSSTWAIEPCAGPSILGPAFSLYGGGLAFSPDGTQVAATVGPDVLVVDVATGAVQRYTDGTRCCADQVLFVDGGRKLATARYGYDPVGSGSPAVTLLDLANGSLTIVVQKNDIYGWMNLAASADGTTLVAFRESEVYAGNVSTGAPLTPVLTPGLFRDVLAVDATAGFVGVTADDRVNDLAQLQVLRIADGAVVRELDLERGLVPAFWSLDHDRLVVTIQDPAGGSRLGVIDTESRQTVARACSPATANPYAFATAAPRLIARVGDGLAVYDASTGQAIGPVLGAGDIATSLAIAPDGGWAIWTSYVSNSSYEVTLANAVTGEQQMIAGPTNSFLTAVPSSGGQLAAVEDQSGQVQVINVTSGATRAELDGHMIDGALVGFSADSTALIFNNEDNLKAVDWQTGTVVPSSLPTQQSLAPAAQAFMSASGDGCGVGLRPYATFSADGSIVAVGSYCSRPWELGVNPQSELYDVASGNLIQSLPGQPLLSSDGTMLALGAALWCR